jgi:hypothetical protein
MHVCVHMMWCGCVVYLYTSVRLSNRSGRVRCEMSGSEQIRKTLWKKASKRISSSLNQDHAGRICEVLQADGHSSMYRSMIV